MKRVFGELEMPTLWTRLAPLLGDDEAPLPRLVSAGVDPAFDVTAVTATVPATEVEALAALEALADAGLLSLAPVWSGDPGRSALLGLAVAGRRGRGGRDVRSATPPCGSGPICWPPGLCWPGWPDCSVPGGPAVAGHGVKELMRVLLPEGIDMVGLALDSAVAAYLLDPSSGRYRLEDVVDAQLGVALDASVEARAAGQLDLDGTAAEDGAAQADEAARRAVALGAVVAPLRAALEGAGLTRLHDEVERPLVRVLAKMEVAGIGVDAAELRRITDGFIAECGRLEAEIHRQAGEVFNVNSTPQLRAVLYERLGLTPGKKTKTGFSTDAQTLEKIKDQHPVVETLLRYREVEKLRSTYGESLLGEVAADGRIHATFQQTVARTGRLSSDRPNLHNIPVRTDEGRQLRKAFVPSEGHRLAGGRLRPDRVAGHRPPGRRPRTHRGLRGRGGHPPDDGGPGLRGARPRRSPGPSATGPRWSPTAWPTAWRPSVWPSAWASRPARPRRSWTPTSAPSPRSGPTWSRRWTRPAPRVTPRPSSAAAVLCPTSTRPTGASAWRPNARP